MKRIFLISILTLLVLISGVAETLVVDGIWYNVNPQKKTAEVTYNQSGAVYHVVAITIPETIPYKNRKCPVVGIGERAFSRSETLTKVTLSSKIKYVSNEAFADCKQLAEISLPERVDSIGVRAFYNCVKLENINLPNGLKVITKQAFQNCKGLKTIQLPAALVSIESNAFDACEQLNVINMPDSVRQINSQAFANCKNLVKVEYGELKPEIADDAFVNCPELAAIPTAKPKKSAVKVVQVRLTSDVDKDIPQTNLSNNKTFAVIIANENYQQVVKVPYAINDGTIFRDYCKMTLGIPEQNIHFRADATLNHIRTEVDWLTQISKAYNGDVKVIFYYAGHGIPDEQSRSAYLLPVDGVGNNVQTGFKLDDLYLTLGKNIVSNDENVSPQIVVLLDACFSGSKRENGMLTEARGVAIKVNPNQPIGNMVVLSASTDDETAYPIEQQKHGMFTYYLLKKLKETKGEATIQEISDYVKTNVSQQSVVLNSKSQTPTISASPAITNWEQWKLK